LYHGERDGFRERRQDRLGGGVGED
jgi:hypothetical protein